MAERAEPEAEVEPVREGAASVETVVAHFLACFEQLRYRGPEDAFAASGRERLGAEVATFVRAGEPIALLLPGFPHKNPNPDKTLGPLPELGETLALRRLAGFCAQVSEVYRPAGQRSGCILTIFSDGRIWGDLLGVAPAQLEAYGVCLRAITGLEPHLRFASLDDHPEALGGEGEDQGSVAARLDASWASPAARRALAQSIGLEREGVREPERRRVYERFVRLCAEDRVFDPGCDAAAREALCESAALQMILRHAAFSELLARAYSGHIRLSAHAGSNAGPKYALRLFEGHDECVLPYHHCVVTEAKGERARVMTRAQALELPGGVTLVRNERGEPWCFERKLQLATP